MDAEGRIEAALAPHPSWRLEMAVWRQVRAAVTLWKVEQRFRNHALLRVFPKTGKTHQIRVHLKHIGLPLAVDPLYNPRAGPIMLSAIKRNYRPTRGEEERPLISRLTLHAEKLRFVGLDGAKVEVVAGVPKDFRAVVKQMGKG